MKKFEQEMTIGKREKEEQEKYNTIRDVLNEKAMIGWEHIKEAMLSEDEKKANAKLESCSAKYGNTEFHATKIKIYDEALKESNKPRYEGLLMDKLFFDLTSINNDVASQIATNNLPEKDLERLRSQSYKDVRELLKDVSETIGVEKAQLVLDRWHENIEPSRDYLTHLRKVEAVI